MSKEIVLTDIRETQWGEEAVIDSPYEALDYIKVLPWRTYEDEVDKHGSLEAKAKDGDSDISDAALDALNTYVDSNGFPDDFATHATWDSDIEKWTIDVDGFNEARQFWEYCGFNVSVDPSIDKSTL